MSIVPRELTAPWEQGCRRCQSRVLGAFDNEGRGVQLDAQPVYGGDVELLKLSTGFRVRAVAGEGGVERYVRHACPNAEPERPAASETSAPGDVLMPFGRHRGERLTDINSHYLNWALENADIRTPELRRAIAAVVTGRRTT